MKQGWRLAAGVAAVLLALGAGPAGAAEPSDVGQRVEALLRQMTLEEKVGQLNQLSGKEFTGPATDKVRSMETEIRSGRVGSMLNIKGVPDTRRLQALALQSRLKIPLLFGLDVIHGYQTVFPVPLGESASWDLDEIEESSRIAAREAAASGIHWTFAPMVDVGRDPRWGRVMEGAGEDSYLGARIAAARVRGFQGKQLGGVESVMATAKHFATYGAAIAGRDYNAVDMSEHLLHETYLPPFKAALDAGAATFMNAFNTLNGIPATAHSGLQRDILKGAWGFKGFVVSDWGSVREMVVHGYAADLPDAAAKALVAGSDMDMESNAYSSGLVAQVKAGKVPEPLVDDAVRRVLTKKFELGLFDDPYRFSNAERERAALNDPRHRQAARRIAGKSIVLLKNEKAALPLRRGLRSIAVIGPLADARRDLEGGWIVKSDAANLASLVDAVREQAGPSTRVTYAPGCDVACRDDRGFKAALDAASAADAVVLAVGESWDMSGEAKSRADIGLPGRQGELFDALRAIGKTPVVVMMAGRPMTFENVAEQADAILYAWFPGSEGGRAIADVLFGAVNPSAKLPMSFPRNLGQVPISYQQYETGRPVRDEKNIVYKSAYIDSPNTPRYAFGHGLSYTRFAYRDLRLSASAMAPNGKLTLSFTLANTGKVAGAEVVQLYLRDPLASVVRPVKELKGFQRIELQPGQQKIVSFSIDRDTLAFHNRKLEWVAEPGKFELMVGSASDDIRLRDSITLTER
ncbi:glycoside hydrolase family 3 C-terminal domain-containing protein [Massilia sp. IC2-477]|uniref:glycoside hydrolase family 3 N-terminal domain-containing protein n=1 Tax=Massilia sp. IC2-477 TaxID=2887198 RepID=UPI001D0FF65B|nr:glycoside hydrolase family 3 N-terminal domain-containing protein [Massilia sp. IC2-477]MCC2957426.1 glycoside hydrolase family 3 C-terminal domain-containing protein [Massilia sp. IC2-477]